MCVCVPDCTHVFPRKCVQKAGGSGGGAALAMAMRYEMRAAAATPCSPPHLPHGNLQPNTAHAVACLLTQGVVQPGFAYVQCALLYTNSNGERRIRCARDWEGGATRPGRRISTPLPGS